MENIRSQAGNIRAERKIYDLIFEMISNENKKDSLQDLKTVLKKLYASSVRTIYTQGRKRSLDNFMSYNNLKYMIFDKISTTSTYPFLEVTLTQNWKST